MSKSNAFLPGAYDFANGVYFHVTLARENPSCFATAKATALSKPLPEFGSLIFQGDPFGGSPENHRGEGRVCVPTGHFPPATLDRSGPALGRRTGPPPGPPPP